MSTLRAAKGLGAGGHGPHLEIGWEFKRLTTCSVNSRTEKSLKSHTLRETWLKESPELLV